MKLRGNFWNSILNPGIKILILFSFIECQLIEFAGWAILPRVGHMRKSWNLFLITILLTMNTFLTVIQDLSIQFSISTELANFTSMKTCVFWLSRLSFTILFCKLYVASSKTVPARLGLNIFQRKQTHLKII